MTPRSGALMVALLALWGQAPFDWRAVKRSRCSVGPHDVWVLIWNEGDVCDPRVVMGNGFEREGFVAALRRGGVVAAET